MTRTRLVIEVIGWLLFAPLALFSLWLMVVGVLCQGC